ncbi:DUF7344 domain-containing protein [Haladaptatus halobius]
MHEESNEARAAEQIQFSLAHTHIPKLVDYEIIKYDRQD